MNGDIMKDQKSCFCHIEHKTSHHTPLLFPLIIPSNYEEMETKTFSRVDPMRVEIVKQRDWFP